MYVKRHAVVKGGRRYVYLRLVQAYRDTEGRVRHEVLRTLGRKDELKASGQLEQLAASFARLDPPPAGTRRHVGPLLLVAHYVHRLGLVGLVDDAVPMRGRAMLTHGEVIAALVANRLCAPAPLYDVAGWASSAAMAELFGVPAGLLNDDRLGRALEALAPVAERVRGELALAAASRCGADLSRLHLDMTAVRFTGGYEGSALVARGWAADRTIARQVKTLQASTRTGVAVYYRGHPGGSNEAPCVAAALERIRELAPPGVVCVADYYGVISVPCMSFYGCVYPGHALACGIQKSCPLFVKLLAAVRRNPMGADHHLLAGAVLNPVFVHHPLFLQHGKHLPVMDKRSEGADILTLLPVLDGVHGDFDSAPDSFAKACRPGDDNFHDYLVFQLGMVGVLLRQSNGTPDESRQRRNSDSEKDPLWTRTGNTVLNPTNFVLPWQPCRQKGVI